MHSSPTSSINHLFSSRKPYRVPTISSSWRCSGAHTVQVSASWQPWWSSFSKIHYSPIPTDRSVSQARQRAAKSHDLKPLPTACCCHVRCPSSDFTQTRILCRPSNFIRTRTLWQEIFICNIYIHKATVSSEVLHRHVKGTKIKINRKGWYCPFTLWSYVEEGLPKLCTHKDSKLQSTRGQSPISPNIMNPHGAIPHSPSFVEHQNITHTSLETCEHSGPF